MNTALSSTLSTISMCLAAIRCYGTDEDRVKAVMAQGVLEGLTDRHGAQWIEIDEEFPDLELRTFAEMLEAITKIRVEHRIGIHDDEDNTALEHVEGYLFEIAAMHGIDNNRLPIAVALTIKR